MLIVLLSNCFLDSLSVKSIFRSYSWLGVNFIDLDMCKFKITIKKIVHIVIFFLFTMELRIEPRTSDILSKLLTTRSNLMALYKLYFCLAARDTAMYLKCLLEVFHLFTKYMNIKKMIMRCRASKGLQTYNFLYLFYSSGLDLL
jgi:hypothetical protein